MLFAPLQRYLPKSPLPKRDATLRAELTHLSTQILKLEKEQEVHFKRMAQLQQEIDEIKRLLKKLVADT